MEQCTGARPLRAPLGAERGGRRAGLLQGGWVLVGDL